MPEFYYTLLSVSQLWEKQRVYTLFADMRVVLPCAPPSARAAETTRRDAHTLVGEELDENTAAEPMSIEELSNHPRERRGR